MDEPAKSLRFSIFHLDFIFTFSTHTRFAIFATRGVNHNHLGIEDPDSPWTGDLKCRNVGGCFLFFLVAVVVSSFTIDVCACASIR